MSRPARRRELERAISPCRGRVGPLRVAMVSMHTSPLAQPGTGDAGGMNVYVRETATELAKLGINVEIFTRATASTQPLRERLPSGVTVHHIQAGPFEGIEKNQLPSQLCTFTAGLLREEASRPVGYFDVIHSHYWLSGQAGWLAADRWDVPLVHTAHTLAKVKNRHLADDDQPEPVGRIIGEEQLVTESNRLVTNTDAEARQLIDLYDADPGKVAVTPPGVNPVIFSPGDQSKARKTLGLRPDAFILGFAGRIQRLKAPDVVLRAHARMKFDYPHLADRLHTVIVGGPSGNGVDNPRWLHDLAVELDIGGAVTFLPPRHGSALADVFRACDVVCVPSHNETFGLVALEAQACGVPVAAANVGGLTTAVRDDHSGILVAGHTPAAWSASLGALLTNHARHSRLSEGARAHASEFTWARTAQDLVKIYTESVDRHGVVSRRPAELAGR